MADETKKGENQENPNLFLQVITEAMKVPGIKVNRRGFLYDQFKDKTVDVQDLIVRVGPIEAGCTRDELKKKAQQIITSRTAMSSVASFVAGLPGGLAMAATVPADMIQYYGVSIRMAQEIAYLYGEEDFFDGDQLDMQRVNGQMILYCGVMLGAAGAAQTVRLVAAAVAKQVAKKLPQKALTKTFYYPIVKSVAKLLGQQMTKGVFAKGVSKAVPIIGGIVSGGITVASMIPMGNRLVTTLDKACFDYTESEAEADVAYVSSVVQHEDKEAWQEIEKTMQSAETEPDENAEKVDPEVQRLKTLLDEGKISQKEYDVLVTLASTAKE